MADGSVLERLVVQFDADIQKLTDKVNGVNRTVHGAVDSWEKRFGQLDLGKALNTASLQAANGVMGQATAKLGALGGALQGLGPYGLAAAAAIAAVGAALDLGAKAAEWADQLVGAAQKIGVTTTALQEMDYVAAGAGVPIEAMRAGLESLNEVMGKVQGNLARGLNNTQAKAFKILDITPTDLKTYQNASELLPVIADRIRQLKTSAEQSAVAKALGLEELLPLLKKGGDAIRGMATEAETMGAVVGGKTVAEMANLADETHQADIRMKAASERIGADMVPALVALKNAAADAANYIADLFEHPFGNDAEKWGQHMSNAFHYQARAAALRSGDPLKIMAAGGTLAEVLNPKSAEFMAQRQDKMAGQEFGAAGDIQANTRNQQFANERDHADKPTGSLNDLPPASHKPRGPTPEEIKKNSDDAVAQGAQELDDAIKAGLQAQLALTSDLQQRKLIQDAIADTDRQARDAAEARRKAELDLQLQQGKITQAAHDKALADMRSAKFAEGIRDQLQHQLDDRVATDAATTRTSTSKQRDLQDQVALAEAQKGLATTSQQRRQLELRILDLDDQIEEAKLNEIIALKSSTPDQVRDARSQLDSLHQTRPLRQQAVENSTASPLDAYIRQLQTDTGAGFNDQAGNLMVQGLKGVNQALVEAITNSKNLGESLGDVLRNIGQQLLSLGIEKYLTLPLAQMLNLIPGPSGVASAGLGAGSPMSAGVGIAQAIAGLAHFAGGTPSAPGGLSVIGENGPELMDVPAGAKIIPNSAIRSVSVQPGMAAGGGGGSYFDLRGAVMTDDLLQQMNVIASRQAQQQAMHYSAASVAGMRQVIPAEQARRAAFAMH